jgi:O-antigen ligase
MSRLKPSPTSPQPPPRVPFDGAYGPASTPYSPHQHSYQHPRSSAVVEAPIASSATAGAGQDAAPQRPYEPPSGLDRFLGSWVIVVYLFLLFSRAHDLVAYLHLPIFMQCAGIVAMLVAGIWPDVLRNRTTVFIVGLTLWMFATIPLSTWPGGAFRAILDRWIGPFLLYFLITSLLLTARQVRKAIFGVVLGIGFGALTSIIFSADLAGRHVMSNTSRFSDPNDLAQFMLVGMCLLAGLFQSTSSKFVKLVLLPTGLMMFLVFVRTGSRGGFIALIAVIGTLLWYGTARQKVAAFVLGFMVVLGILMFAPESVRDRYMYVLGRGDAAAGSEDRSGEGAAQSRKTLFLNSVRLTILHPVFGVGTGMFAVADNSLAMSDGLRSGMWHETHNMYTQISSENGIPGLVLFLGALFRSVRRLGYLSQYKVSSSAAAQSVAQQAYWLRVALIGFMVTGMFLSVAYTEILVTMIGLTVALDRTSEPVILHAANAGAASK